VVLVLKNEKRVKVVISNLKKVPEIRPKTGAKRGRDTCFDGNYEKCPSTPNRHFCKAPKISL